MSDLNAALGLSQILKLKEKIKLRKKHIKNILTISSTQNTLKLFH